MRTGASTAPRREHDPHDLALARRRAARRPPATGRASRRGAAATRSRRLHAGVVRVEPAAGGQAERELVVELVDRRLVLDRDEGRPRAAAPAAPRAGRAGTARPDAPRRSTATAARRAPPAARSSCRACMGDSARSSFQMRLGRPAGPSRAPGAAPARTGWRCRRARPPAASSALRTRCTRRSLFVTVPSDSHHAGGGREDHVRPARPSRSGTCPGRSGSPDPSSRCRARCRSASDCSGFSPMT